jgi:hypothetical protein
MKDTKFRILLDIHEVRSQATIPVKVGDVSCKIYITLVEGGKPYKIHENSFGVFTGKKGDNNPIFNNCIIENGIIRYDFTPQTVAAAGVLECEVRIYDEDGGVLTTPSFNIIVDERAVNDSEIESTSEFSFLDEIIVNEGQRIENEKKRIAAYNNIDIDVEDSADYVTVKKTNKDGSQEEVVIAKGKNSVSPEHIVYELNKDSKDSTVPSSKSVVKYTNNVAAELSQEIAVERARITNLATLKEGSTTGDAELIDGRVDYKGNTHANIGEHIRSVTGQTSRDIDEIVGYRKMNENKFIRGAWNTDTNTLIELDYRVMTEQSFITSSDTIFKVANGFEQIIYTYTENGCSGSGFIDTDILIAKGTTIRVGIKRKIQDTNEIADISEFVNAILMIVNVDDRVNELLNSIDKIVGYRKMNETDFIHGAFDNTNWMILPTYTNRIISKPFITNSDTVFKVASDFYHNIYTLTNGAWEQTGFIKTDILIPKGTTIRVGITTENMHDTTIVADISEYVNAETMLINANDKALETSANRLQGKKINVIGDSYVAYDRTGYNYSTITNEIKEMWHYKLAQKYGMTYRNYGWSGNPLIDNSEVATRGEPVINRYSAMDNDADYIVIIGGKNDYNVQIPIEDFKNGLHSLCQGLVEKYIGKNICFITPWRIPESTLTELYGGVAKSIPVNDYVDAIVEVCKEYSIPCFDTKDSNIAIFNATFRSNYMKSANDVSHLNSAGHDLMLPKGESFLLKL